MVKLLDSDVRTREVLTWTGVHLFHFHASSCSQKTRIFLNLKGIEWNSHPVDLMRSENFSEWFLGINPRGLVPALVMDGEVHIESNDILMFLERRFPLPRLIPAGHEDEVQALLHHEDELHLDLRTLSVRFMVPRGKTLRSPESLDRYRAGGSGTVLGKADPDKAREIAWWQSAASAGITDEAARASALRFRAALDELDQKLTLAPWLIGNELSLLDIAWFIYVNRLILCGYPVDRLHPRVFRRFEPLRDRAEFAREVSITPEARKFMDENQSRLKEAGETLRDVTGF